MAIVLKCPRDGTESKVEAHEGRHGPFRLDVCPKCGGVFFDNGEITKLTNDREVERLIVAYAAGAADFPCPRCGGPVARRPVGEATLFVCAVCRGVWADCCDLETASRTFVEEGTHHRGPILAEGVAESTALAMAAFASPKTLRRILTEEHRGPGPK